MATKFQVTWTWSEALEAERSLNERYDRLIAMPLNEMSDKEKSSAGTLETMLRRDFQG